MMRSAQTMAPAYAGKFEARSTKSETIFNDRISNIKTRSCCFYALSIRNCFVLRISDFVLCPLLLRPFLLLQCSFSGILLRPLLAGTCPMRHVLLPEEGGNRERLIVIRTYLFENRIDGSDRHLLLCTFLENAFRIPILSLCEKIAQFTQDETVDEFLGLWQPLIEIQRPDHGFQRIRERGGFLAPAAS